MNSPVDKAIQQYIQTKITSPKLHQQNANTMMRLQSQSDHVLQNDQQKQIEQALLLT